MCGWVGHLCRIYRGRQLPGARDTFLAPLRYILNRKLSVTMSAIAPVQILKTLSSPSSSSGAFHRVRSETAGGSRAIHEQTYETRC